jgi:hypothetical protein
VAIGLQQVHRPIPAIGRLDHDVGVVAGVRDRQRQRHRIVGDPHTRDLLALGGHRVDHRAAAMQVNTDATSFHRASLVVAVTVRSPECLATLGSSRGAETPHRRCLSTQAASAFISVR